MQERPIFYPCFEHFSFVSVDNYNFQSIYHRGRSFPTFFGICRITSSCTHASSKVWLWHYRRCLFSYRYNQSMSTSQFLKLVVYQSFILKLRGNFMFIMTIIQWSFHIFWVLKSQSIFLTFCFWMKSLSRLVQLLRLL